MISVLQFGMLCITDHACSSFRIVVFPQQTADLIFATGRGDGEVPYVQHGNLGAPVTKLKVFVQCSQLGIGRSPIAAAALRAAFNRQSTPGDCGRSPRDPGLRSTFFAARRATPIQTRSFPAVEGPAPCKRRVFMNSTSRGPSRVR